MFKKIIILTLSFLAFASNAQDYKKMSFDLSEEMIEVEEQKAQINLLVEKEGNVIAQSSSILRNGKVYPLIQLTEDNQLFGLEKVKQEQEVRRANFLVQSAWHINKDKNIWIQLFIEEFDKKISLSNKEDYDDRKNKAPSVEPAAIKNKYEITLSLVDEKEVKTQWGGYNFIFSVKRK